MPKLPPGGDAELGEHLAQGPFHGACADEEVGADLRVRQAVTGQPGDLLLLWREPVSRVGAAVTNLATRSSQSSPGAVGEGRHADLGELAVRGTQLLARLGASTG